MHDIPKIRRGRGAKTLNLNSNNFYDDGGGGKRGRGRKPDMGFDAYGESRRMNKEIDKYGSSYKHDGEDIGNLYKPRGRGRPRMYDGGPPTDSGYGRGPMPDDSVIGLDGNLRAEQNP